MSLVSKDRNGCTSQFHFSTVMGKAKKDCGCCYTVGVSEGDTKISKQPAHTSALCLPPTTGHHSRLLEESTLLMKSLVHSLSDVSLRARGCKREACEGSDQQACASLHPQCSSRGNEGEHQASHGLLR